MTDSQYSQASQNMGPGWQPIKLRDLGDGTYAVAQVNVGGWDARNITSGSTTTIKTGAGILGSIVVNSAVSLGTITVYDNTAASGTKIATITHPLTLLSSQYVLMFNSKFATGLTVVTSLGDNITVTYI